MTIFFVMLYAGGSTRVYNRMREEKHGRFISFVTGALWPYVLVLALADWAAEWSL